MFEIDELIDIIKQLNNSAQFDEIIKLLQHRHNMLLFFCHKKLILDQLQNNPYIFYFDVKTNTWSLAKKYQDFHIFKLSMNQLQNVLRKVEELDPNVHDGSYELVQKTVSEYAKLNDLSSIDVDDMNFIYSISIGTWKTSSEIRKNRLELTHLTNESKKIISKLIDDIWNKACSNVYDNSILIPKKPGYGMFGTGFMTFSGKLSDKDSSRFITMMTQTIGKNDDLEIYNICEKVLNDDSFEGYGMKAGSASVMLHCLNPFVFPIINGNDKHGTIYERLDLNINKIKSLRTYISNCRVIKQYRDQNYSFKNYRILDMSTWALDNRDFDYRKFFHIK